MFSVRKTRPTSIHRLRAALTLGVALALAAHPAAADDEERSVVVLLPVVIHSMDDQDFLRAGLGDMLVSRLGREPRLAVVPIRDAEAATTDLETARAHARASGAQYVVYGSFTHFGQGASVDLICAAADGDSYGPREVFVHAGALGEIIPTLDTLMDRVARYIVDGGTVASVEAPVEASADPVLVETAPAVDALVRRIEAIEQELGINTDTDSDGEADLAVEDEPKVPGIFQVYEEDGSESSPN